ncbi:dirigent protein 9-like [Tripterygium wilfordii]|uniref:dirigent protein 9-like n=1 Tax=Tripterygium wilfordii TaxID=458696 RepID=UPI0018F81DD2|nr:dirigent protein 9-like [Tripterygium wilfordii]
MVKPFNLNKPTICLLLLSIALELASSARILDDLDPQRQTLTTPTATTLPSSQVPAVATTITSATPANSSPDAVAASVAPPVPVTATATGAGTTTTGATSANPSPHKAHLTFFMHDILGGIHPSAKVVTGIIARSVEEGGVEYEFRETMYVNLTIKILIFYKSRGPTHGRKSGVN